MQIIINTETDKPGAIANMAKFLLLGFGASADVAALVKAQVMQVPSPEDTKPAPGNTSTTSTQVVPEVPKAPAVPQAPAAPVADPAAVFGGATAPVPVAPTSIPVPTGTLGDVKRDSAGVPWDARIHAGTQTTKQDGTWKLKKGVDAAIVATVLAEIGAVKAADVAPLVPAAPAAVPQIPAVPGVPAAAIPSAVPSTPAGTPVTTFRGVMAKMNAAVGAGKFAKGDVDAMLNSLGIAPDAIAKLVLPAELTNLQAFDALLTAGGA